jgi:hypothetical protein
VDVEILANGKVVLPDIGIFGIAKVLYRHCAHMPNAVPKLIIGVHEMFVGFGL